LKKFLLLLLFPLLAHAWEPNPKQPITVLLPTTAGSGGEVTARLITSHIESKGKATFALLNKAGADGNIMLKQLLESAPDGYTVGIPSCVSGFLFSEAHFSNLITRSPMDLTLVTNIGKSPMAFVASSKSNVNSIPELVKEVTSGREINFAVGGSAHYLAFEYFMQNVNGNKEKVIPIVFKGPVPAVTSVAQYDGKTGTEFGVMPIAIANQLVATGKVKLIGVAGETKLAGIPKEVPLMKDSVAGLNVYGCWNVALPPNTPPEIAKWYEKNFIAALKTAEYKKFMEENYIFLDPKSVGPTGVRKDMVELQKQWLPYVKSLPKPN
jgi:tripartite-type tricarboxylate transporter receptor subunit TctC